MNSLSMTPDSYPQQRDLRWSKSEKAIARKAFDTALQRELIEVMQQAKQRASLIKESADLWDLEFYLTQRRKEINPQVRLPVLATHTGFRETLARRPDR